MCRNLLWLERGWANGKRCCQVGMVEITTLLHGWQPRNTLLRKVSNPFSPSRLLPSHPSFYWTVRRLHYWVDKFGVQPRFNVAKAAKLLMMDNGQWTIYSRIQCIRRSQQEKVKDAPKKMCLDRPGVHLSHHTGMLHLGLVLETKHSN
jgi:hypothetical protein